MCFLIIFTCYYVISVYMALLELLYCYASLFTGMGFNMVTLTSFVIVQQHFKKFRALAAAIAASGISVGSLCSGPLLTAMLNAFQWRGTLLLLSGMVLNCCVFGALYRPPPIQSPSKDANHQKSGSSNATGMTLSETLQQQLQDMTNLALFSNMPFTLVCFGTFLMNLGLMVFMQHTPSRAHHLGIDRPLAYFLPTVSGVALLVGRILGGVVGNLSCTNRLLQYGVSIITCGLLIIVLGTLTTFQELAVFGAAVGFVTGMLTRILLLLLSLVTKSVTLTTCLIVVLIYLITKSRQLMYIKLFVALLSYRVLKHQACNVIRTFVSSLSCNTNL